MSKHKLRRQRRISYFATLDATLEYERQFVTRVVDTLDHKGIDCATPDGKPIKADFRRYIKERRKTNPAAADACVDLLERAVRSISPRPKY